MLKNKSPLRNPQSKVKAGEKGRISPHLGAVLMLGATSQIGQVLLLRELLMVFHGNELTLGLILASWLLWVGAGSRCGVALVKKFYHSTTPFSLLKFNTAGLVLVLPATLLLVRLLRGFFDILPGAHLSLTDTAISCFLVMAPACLMLGAQFIFLARAWRKSSRALDTSGAEKTYAGEAAGNMLGGAAFTFLMVHHLNTFQSALLAGLLMLAAVLYMLKRTSSREEAEHHDYPRGTGVTHKEEDKDSVYNTAYNTNHNTDYNTAAVRTGPPTSLSRRLAPALLIVAAALAFPLLEPLDQWAYRLQWEYFSPEYELLETITSRHGTISVVRHRDQYSFYQSGHLVFTTAGPETPIPGMEEQEAVDFANLAMVQHKNPERVLLIGGGFRGTLQEIINHPVERVDYIELDPELTGAAFRHLPEEATAPMEDPRVNLIHGDGRLFAKTAEQEYDLVVVDVPDPFTAEINRYYTKEFFREIKNLLPPEGVLVTETTSTPDLRGTAIANRNTALFHTLNQVFPRVLPAGEQSMVYFASRDPDQITLDASSLEERYRQRDIQVKSFSPGRYHTLLEETQLERVNWVVRNHGRSDDARLAGPGSIPPFPGAIAEQEHEEKQLPGVKESHFVNADLRPVLYYYTLTFWEDLTREDHPFSLQRLLQVEAWWILPLAALPLLATLGLKASPTLTKGKVSTRFAVLFTAFTTGLSTMALQVALLFSFQGIYGFVYEMVGLVTAMFMCGLALGAFLAHRWVKIKDSLSTLAGMQLLMALWAAAIAFLLPQAAGMHSPPLIFSLFSLLTFTAGIINGIDFPLAASCYLSLNRQTGRVEHAAGAAYAWELLGACAGATLVSVIVAPILGITASCLLASVASGTAFLVLLVVRKDGI